MISFDIDNFADVPVHEPIFVEEILSFIKREHSIIVDATTGEGGHSSKILESAIRNLILLCLDADSDILSRASSRLQKYRKGTVHFANDNFRNIKAVLSSHGIAGADFILADLGISSYHYFESQRGFSFNDDALLDMRLDTSSGMPLYEVLPDMEEEEICDILFRYADESYSKRIAKAIYTRRKSITRAKELSVIVQEAKKGYRGKIHPATKTFMAFRIYINKELENLNSFMQAIPDCLNSGGRLIIISFHSVEDRIVKDFIRRYSFREKENKFRPAPVNKSLGINLTKKPLRPCAKEVISNPRARSARLRAFERL